jgi:hypothetical protein
MRIGTLLTWYNKERMEWGFRQNWPGIIREGWKRVQAILARYNKGF